MCVCVGRASGPAGREDSYLCSSLGTEGLVLAGVGVARQEVFIEFDDSLGILIIMKYWPGSALRGLLAAFL